MGYCEGLVEKNPDWCENTSVIDSFDAMTSDRPYRKALSEGVAIAELEKVPARSLTRKLSMLFESLRKGKKEGRTISR